MSYSFVVMGYPECYDDVRSVFGVDDETLKDDVINSLPNMPAAEMQVLSLVPDYLSLDSVGITKLRLAIIYHTAANCYQTVKINVLRIETDNKTMGTRFNDTFKMTEEDLRKRASGYITELLPSGTGTSDLFSVFSPSIDVITGS